jgi:predicted nucleic acid-binding protein
VSPLYIDTSCLLKLLWPEPESVSVATLLAAESEVVVSDLVHLELAVFIRGRRAGGLLAPSGARKLLAMSDTILAQRPFALRASGGMLIEDARRRVDVADGKAHCRTLDLLHIAALQAMGLSRLLTNDDAQARVAKRAGIEVLRPGA